MGGVCTWSGHAAIEWKGGFASGDCASRTRFSQHIWRPPLLPALMDNPASPPLPVHWGSGHLSVHFVQCRTCHPSTGQRSATSETRSPSSGHPGDNRQAPRSSEDWTTFLESTFQNMYITCCPFLRTLRNKYQASQVFPFSIGLQGRKPIQGPIPWSIL